MPSNTIGSNGWLRIVDGRAQGFYSDEEAAEELFEVVGIDA